MAKTIGFSSILHRSLPISSRFESFFSWIATRSTTEAACRLEDLDDAARPDPGISWPGSGGQIRGRARDSHPRGFEDRVSDVRRRPARSAQDRNPRNRSPWTYSLVRPYPQVWLSCWLSNRSRRFSASHHVALSEMVPETTLAQRLGNRLSRNLPRAGGRKLRRLKQLPCRHQQHDGCQQNRYRTGRDSKLVRLMLAV